MEGFALGANVSFVGQNAARLFSGLFEVALAKRWSRVAKIALELAKMVQQRQWKSMTPLRQFNEMPVQLIRALERRDFPFARMFELNQQELGELVRAPKYAHLLHSFLAKFPRVSFESSILPLSAGMARLELTINYLWEISRGESELFWLFVQDVDGDQLLWYDLIAINEQEMRHNKSRSIIVTLPLFDPVHPNPNYHISVLSDRWLGSETTQPVRFDSMIVPDKFTPPTELLDLEPILASEIFPSHFYPDQSEQLNVFSGCAFDRLNPIQSQLVHFLNKSASLEQENVFIGAPAGSGKTLLVEFLIFRSMQSNRDGKIVYVAPSAHQFKFLQQDWIRKFECNIAILTNDQSVNLEMLQDNTIVLCTVRVWERVSRKWRARQRLFQQVSLLICDDLHQLGSSIGPCYEAMLTRTKLMNLSGITKQQLMFLSCPLANYQDFSEWMGCTARFNFSPVAQRAPLKVLPIPTGIGNHTDQLLWMCRATWKSLLLSKDTNALVIVPDTKMLTVAAEEYLMLGCKETSNELDTEELKKKIQVFSVDPLLQSCILDGRFAFLHESLTFQAEILDLFTKKHVKLLLITKEAIHLLPPPIRCSQLFNLGNEQYNCREHSPIDYSLVDLLKISGKYQQSATFYCQRNRMQFYEKILFEPVPIESHLHLMTRDVLLGEICSTKSITNKQEAIEYFSCTFLGQRLPHNPSYYGIQDSFEPGMLSEYFSGFVETTLSDLEQHQHISILKIWNL